MFEELTSELAVAAADTAIFYVNGTRYELPGMEEGTLVQFLRENGLTGTGLGCGEGGGGACRVMVSSWQGGKVQHRQLDACLCPLYAVEGCHVVTTEGTGSMCGGVHPVQATPGNSSGSQSGFCTPGFVMSMYLLLRSNGGEGLSAPAQQESMPDAAHQITPFTQATEAVVAKFSLHSASASVYRSRRSQEGWRAQFSYDNKVINLGTFTTHEEAARVWDEVALLFRGMCSGLAAEAAEAAASAANNAGGSNGSSSLSNSSSGMVRSSSGLFNSGYFGGSVAAAPARPHDSNSGCGSNNSCNTKVIAAAAEKAAAATAAAAAVYANPSSGFMFSKEFQAFPAATEYLAEDDSRYPENRSCRHAFRAYCASLISHAVAAHSSSSSSSSSSSGGSGNSSSGGWGSTNNDGCGMRWLTPGLSSSRSSYRWAQSLLLRALYRASCRASAGALLVVSLPVACAEGGDGGLGGGGTSSGHEEMPGWQQALLVCTAAPMLLLLWLVFFIKWVPMLLHVRSSAEDMLPRWGDTYPPLVVLPPLHTIQQLAWVGGDAKHGDVGQRRSSQSPSPTAAGVGAAQT